jgi:hypothetical protein
MKKFSELLVLIMLLSFGALSQSKLPPLDKSPMDMSYLPVNYPIMKIQNIAQNKPTEPLIARIIYSRPQKNGRVVFGELVEYGQVWRLGANEATELELNKDVKIAGNKIKKGRYTMYAIPFIDKWTIILNKETDIWGAFQYDQKKDILRIDVRTEKQDEITEAFTITFEKATGGANMILAWDDVKTVLPFSY